MTMAAIATAVAINVVSTQINKAIAGDPDQPAQIGSGTSPSLSPGSSEMGISPVQGSSVSNFDAPDENQEMILQQLKAAGIDPADLDQYGVAGMAVGGYLKRGLGGGLGLLDFLEVPPTSSGIAGIDVDFSELAMPDPVDLFEEQMLGEVEAPEFSAPEISAPEILPEATTMERLSDLFASQDPTVQAALMKALKSGGGTLAERLVGGKSKRRGSLVSTETLPGNSNRRRSSLEISPVSGSSVTFANQGSALQRPMFMPQGGAMHGAGGPKDDLIPVMASNGEYMLSKAAVDQAGGGSHAMGIANLEKFNKAGNKRYGQ